MNPLIFALYGGLGGLVRAVLGWSKAVKEKKYKFDYFEFGKTVALGLCVGLIASLAPGLTPLEVVGLGLMGDLAIEKLILPSNK